MLEKLLKLLGTLFTGSKLPNITSVNSDPVEETEEDEELIVMVTDVDLKTKVLSDEFINELKKQVFSFTYINNIQENWPLVVDALERDELLDKDMVCYTLATIKVECEVFKSIHETPSKYSDGDGVKPYDYKHYIGKGGNTDAIDAEKFSGAGFIQLSLKNNYQDMDEKLQLDGELLDHGWEAAVEPHIASAILSRFIKDREPSIRKAISISDFKKMRQLVNGPAALGLDKFKEAYLKVEELL